MFLLICLCIYICAFINTVNAAISCILDLIVVYIALNCFIKLRFSIIFVFYAADVIDFELFYIEISFLFKSQLLE